MFPFLSRSSWTGAPSYLTYFPTTLKIMLLSSQQLRPADSHLSPQSASWRHDSSQQSHHHQSYSRMKRLVWWQRCRSGPGAIPPAAGSQRHHLEDWWGFQSSSGRSLISLSCNLIIGWWIEKAQAHERPGKVWRQRKSVTVAVELCVGVQVNLL